MTRAPLLRLAAAVVATGCSAASDARPSSGGRGSGGADPVAVGGAGGGGGFDACVAQTIAADPRPVDLYLLVDQSSSMNLLAAPNATRWDALVTALGDFVTLPAAQSLGVGVGYFGLPPPLCDPSCEEAAGCCGPVPVCWTCDGKVCCADNDLVCDAEEYAVPDVPLAPLSVNGGAVTSSLDGHQPELLVGTPTGPALVGAHAYARSWAKAHRDHQVAVVLASDGEPSGCTPLSIDDIASVVATAAGADPSIPTFAIAVGPSAGNMDAIAVAGATNAAFEVHDDANAGTEFLEAFEGIREALPCSYSLPAPPSGEELVPDQVNVEFTESSSAETETIPNVGSAAGCSEDGGWYYEDPKVPSAIVVCAATCKRFRSAVGGEVSIAFGCATVIK